MTSEKLAEMGGKAITIKKGQPVDMLGVSIDSQSINQSLLNQSMSSVKQRKKHYKQKEDLDGSRVYRNRESVEDSPQRTSLKQKKQYKKDETPVLKKKKS